MYFPCLLLSGTGTDGIHTSETRLRNLVHTHTPKDPRNTEVEVGSFLSLRDSGGRNTPTRVWCYGDPGMDEGRPRTLWFREVPRTSVSSSGPTT